jgi:Site-specific recombinase XerD
MQDREYKNLSKASLTGYKFTLYEFHTYCIGQEIIDTSEVTFNTVKGYLLYCQKERKNTPKSCNHKIINLKAFFNYLEQELELYTPKTNPVKKIVKLQEDIKIEVFTDAQIKLMLNYFAHLKQKDKSFFAMRDTVIIITLLGTGVRLGELVNIKWKDINFKHSIITVFGKKRIQSSIPATNKLIKELAEYKIFCEHTFNKLPQYVFTDREGKQSTPDSVKNMFQRLRIVMNFKDVRLSCHTFRHYFAMKCLMSGMDVFSLKNLLRHTDLKMTERYLAIWGTALKDVNNKHNPLNGFDL